MIFLGNPTEDPHGDPIQTLREKYLKSTKLLSELAINQQGICVGVKDTSSDF
jgi:DtxR family Mn-dependent transcriptional regulator